LKVLKTTKMLGVRYTKLLIEFHFSLISPTTWNERKVTGIGKKAALEMSAMVSLTKAQVPNYLVESEFYKNLSADDEDAFDIPQEFYKPDVSVNNAKDLAHIFSTR